MTIDDEGGDEDGDGGRVNRAFAARLALDEAWPTSPPRVSVAVLAEGLLAGRLNLSPAEWAVVEGDELLRTSWQFLRRSRTLADLPRVAAARSKTGSPDKQASQSIRAVMVVPSLKTL